MAYAAVRSLENTINETLRSAYSSPEILKSASHQVRSLRSTLEKCREGVGDLDEQMIIEAAIKLEDAIEFSLLSQPPTFSFNLDDDIHCFIETAKEREQTIKGSWEQKRAAKEIEEDIEEEEEEEDVEMVGLRDQFLQIRHKVLTAHKQPYVFSGYYRNRVIWISGMAGVGKTALAKKLFHDPLVKTKFQSRAFITVGLKFGSARRILPAIIDQLNLDNGGMGQKSLLLLDDVWDPYLISDLFHGTGLEKEKGIVVLLTTRMESQYIVYFSVKMRFMNEEESWELLRRKVFGEEEYCPPQLVKPGKKIAKKCEGLPLLISAVAPILLSKAQKDPECWNRVAQKPDSVLEEASHQISQLLLKSYDQITELGKNSWSEAEAFRLHCSYWYVSKRVAENNKFLYVIKSYADDLDESIKSHRRLAIQENVLLAIKEVLNEIASIANVRSLLCTGPYNQYEVPICWEWKLLRVLHVLTIRFYEFPVEVVKLIRLKYLALTCNANLPRSIYKLCNLQFLIVHQHLNIKRVGARSYLPVEIWYLRKLIHLEITGRNLPDPPRGGILRDLKSLLNVGVESCTKKVFETFHRLENLRIQIELAPEAPQTLSCFDHISTLFHLKSFQSVIVNSTLSSPPPPLLKIGLKIESKFGSKIGSGIRKLSLIGFGYPWEDMSKIVELNNLEELKLECYAFRGERWEAEEMRFQNLRFLLIEDTDLVQWTSGDKSFPMLCKLTMKNCHKLRQIPLGLPRRLELELGDCNPLAETWAKQSYNCSVTYSWKAKVKSHDDF